MFRNQNRNVNTNKYTKVQEAKVLTIEQLTAMEHMLKNLFAS